MSEKPEINKRLLDIAFDKKTEHKVPILLGRNNLRPQKFSDFVGQEKIKAQLEIAIKASIQLSSPVDHILLSSFLPGTGKTTLANIIAKERKVKFYMTNAGSIERYIDLFCLMGQARNDKNPIIFIDEIHNLKSTLAESIYNIMEDPNNELIYEEPTWGTIVFRMPPFTLIGATAGEQGKLPTPFLDRFGIKMILEGYQIENIMEIIKTNAKRFKLNLNQNIIKALANMSCYTPRIANNLLKQLVNYCIVKKIKTVTLKDFSAFRKLYDLDELGLDIASRTILRILAENLKGALGIDSLARKTRIDKNTMAQIYEPKLLALGFIDYMFRGRTITEKGKEYYTEKIKKHK